MFFGSLQFEGSNWLGHRLLFLLMNRADTNSNNPLKYMLGNSTFVIHVY